MGSVSSKVPWIMRLFDGVIRRNEGGGILAGEDLDVG